MSWDAEKFTDLPKVPARMNQSSVPNPISLGKLISSHFLHPFKTGPQCHASLYKKLTATELIHGKMYNWYYSHCCHPVFSRGSCLNWKEWNHSAVIGVPGQARGWPFLEKMVFPGSSHPSHLMMVLPLFICSSQYCSQGFLALNLASRSSCR